MAANHYKTLMTNAGLEKGNDLLKQKSSTQEKLTELAKREAKIYRPDAAQKQ